MLVSFAVPSVGLMKLVLRYRRTFDSEEMLGLSVFVSLGPPLRVVKGEVPAFRVVLPSPVLPWVHPDPVAFRAGAAFRAAWVVLHLAVGPSDGS